MTTYRQKIPRNNKEDLPLLAKALHLARNRDLVLGFLCLFSGLGVCLWAGISPWGLAVLLWLVGLTFFVAGGKLMYEALVDWNTSKHRLLSLIRSQPRRIIWVYSIETTLSPFGIRLFSSGLMYFKLDDWNEMTVSAPPEMLKLISESLNPVLPHAVFGYSIEREQWYSISPSLLLKENGHV